MFFIHEVRVIPQFSYWDEYCIFAMLCYFTRRQFNSETRRGDKSEENANGGPSFPRHSWSNTCSSRWYPCAREAHRRSTLFLRSFHQADFEAVLIYPLPLIREAGDVACLSPLGSHLVPFPVWDHFRFPFPVWDHFWFPFPVWGHFWFPFPLWDHFGFPFPVSILLFLPRPLAVSVFSSFC